MVQDKIQSLTGPTIPMIYQSIYQSLVDRRTQLVAEIEQINGQITDVVKKAKDEQVDLLRISSTN